MQAITTKFLPPSNSHGARILAKCARGKVTIPFPYGANNEQAHKQAKTALCKRFAKEDAAIYGADYGKSAKLNPWLRATVSGDLPSGETVHVFAKR